MTESLPDDEDLTSEFDDSRLSPHSIQEFERRLACLVELGTLEDDVDMFSGPSEPSASTSGPGLRQSTRHLSFDINESFPDAVIYKNHSLSRATLLHYALWRYASTMLEQAEAQASLLRILLEYGADVHAKAAYKNPIFSGIPTETEFEAIHMAAGLGVVKCMPVLLEYALSSPTRSAADAAEYVCTWATIRPIAHLDLPPNNKRPFVTIFNNRPMLSPRESFQPIHDATFSRQQDTTLWLLEHGAEASTPNQNGQTPLHFVAQHGLADDSPHSIEQVIRSLITHKDGMSSLTAQVDHEHFKPEMRRRIPLELAATVGSQFPRDLMYLLAPSHWDAETDRPRIFQEVLLLARCNTTHAAEVLARSICDKAAQGTRSGKRIREKVRMEVQSFYRPGLFHGSPGGIRDGTDNQEMISGPSLLASLIFMVPKAAVDMLDILVARPLIQDSAKHPIPSRASLRNPHRLRVSNSCQPVVTSYQTDVGKSAGLVRPEWKFDAARLLDQQPEISWHKSLVPQKKEQVAGHQDDMYSINVRVLLWPNLMDLDVCRALVCTWSEDASIFATLPVQSITYWFWNHIGYKNFAVTWILRIIELFALVRWGMEGRGKPEQGRVYCPLSWCILLASVIREVSNLLWRFKEYVRRWYEHWKHDSGLRLMWEPTQFCKDFGIDMVLWALRTLLVWSWRDMLSTGEHMTDSMTESWQALLSINVMVGMARLIYMLRLVDGPGKGILAILETFFSGTIQQMLFICGAIFTNFFVAFVVLVPDMGPREVFLHMYRGLFFGDGAGLDELGLDEVNHNYIHIEVLNGYHVNMNRTLIVIASFVFNVIILNLIIAIYGNEYEKIKKTTTLMFLKQRLRSCCDLVLSHQRFTRHQPPWYVPIFAMVLCALCAAGIILGEHLSMQLPYVSAWSQVHQLMLAAGLMAMAEMNIITILVQGSRIDAHRRAGHERPLFMWMCHRSDFNPHMWDHDEISKQDLKRVSDEMNKRMDGLSNDMKCLNEKMDDRMDRLLNAIHRIEGRIQTAGRIAA